MLRMTIATCPASSAAMWGERAPFPFCPLDEPTRVATLPSFAVRKAVHSPKRRLQCSWRRTWRAQGRRNAAELEATFGWQGDGMASLYTRAKKGRASRKVNSESANSRKHKGEK